MKQFLKDLFANSDGYILIWEKNKQSSFFSIDEIDKIEEKYRGKTDVYIGTGTRTVDLYEKFKASEKPINHRGGKAGVRSVSSIWIDLDIQSGNHQKKNLWGSLASFMELLNDNNFPKPSMTIESGGGYHLYWILNKPILFDKIADKIAFESINKAWTNLFVQLGKKEIDSTWNIDRVLRLPETFNGKYENKEVKIVHQSDVRYNIKTFQSLVGKNAIDKAEVDIKLSSNVKTDDFKFTVDKNASPPFNKFNMLMHNVPEFKLTWMHERSDMKDSSQSSYDMSIATFCVRAGWSDQEIVDGLINNRVLFKQNIDKINRKDYMHNTIRKARSNVESIDAKDRLDDFTLLTKEERTEQRGDIKDSLSKAIGVEIESIKKYKPNNISGESAKYSITINATEILLPDIEHLIRYNKFEAIVAETVGFRIKSFKPSRWREISQLILDLCITINTGLDGTLFGLVLYQLQEYLARYIVVEKEKMGEDDFHLRVSDTLPFTINKHVHLSSGHFLLFLARSSGGQKGLFGQKLTVTLNKLGFVSTVVNYQIGESWKAKRYIKANETELQDLFQKVSLD